MRENQNHGASNEIINFEELNEIRKLLKVMFLFAHGFDERRRKIFR